MNVRLKVLAASLIGALAIHGALSACGGGSSSTANASPNACATWQVAEYNASIGTLAVPGTDTDYVQTLPAGWEPFALDGTSPVLRRCAP
jgi:hypothetical protein